MSDFDPDVFRAILDQEGLEGPRGQNARSLIFRCPMDGCGSKLVVEKRSGKFICFNCRFLNDMQGQAEHLLARLLRCTVDQARQRLYGESRTVLRAYLPPPLFLQEDDDEEELFPLRTYEFHMLPIDDPKAERGAAYLDGRGIGMDLAREYQIRYSPHLRQVIFPITADGRLVGWQGRLVIPNVWTDDQGVCHSAPKSPSARDIPREQVLMYQDRIPVGGAALVAEGPVSSIKGHLVGGNANTMGKTVSIGQLGVLRRKRIKRLNLAMDPDAAEETTRLVRQVGAEMDVYNVQPLPGYGDLGDMPVEAVPDAVAQAERIYSWQIVVNFGGR